ncbi:glycosyltransferase family 4 protein [Helicobacter saguini]|uniref:Glycosyltransferase family 4 protein n=1 Tax=Helicobacter saguini TaxID=1548018 RepID=A0A6B0HS11_9HELI|nr:glycosyltransferase [Helicobacter saguini]MWV62701.1 glycosyltransferase family 4 protein [Helicobacter saguini]MWV66628.1 glycosyltransferase family 4 protein [Helicobacter saguini]MWV68978.1 glycosyltransferase family 4 protein [Helicobacter saguini]MWV71469.1 glycosyltransferase family 4 protein [Helicobacter saguini]
MKKIYILLRDITENGGGERVCANLANAFSEDFGVDSKLDSNLDSNVAVEKREDSKNTESNNYKVEIISFFKTFEKSTFEILGNVKITYLSNLSTIKGSKFRRFFNKTIIRILLSFKAINYIKSNLLSSENIESTILSNDGTFIPIKKIKNVKLLRLWHIKIPKKKKKIFDTYDTLIVLSSNDLVKWQSYHKNVKVIPNFLPTFPPLESLKNFAKSYENANFLQDSNNIESSQNNLDSKNLDSKKHSNFIESKSKKNKKILLAAGRFTHEKGFSRLIDIFSKIIESNPEIRASWELHIVGDGKLKTELTSQIALLKMQDCIKLLPFAKNMATHYENADIYALSSFHEGFGMVVLEATSFALPCVAFDCIARELIDEAKSGFLIPQNDTQMYMQKLLLLMQDSKLREKMGQNARILAQTNFSKEAILPLWQEIL